MGIKTAELLPAVSTWLLSKTGAYESIPHGQEVAALMIGGQILKTISHLSENPTYETAIRYAGIIAGSIGLAHIIAPDQIDSLVPIAKNLLSPEISLVLVGAAVHSLAKTGVEKTTDALADPEKGSSSEFVSAIYDQATTFGHIAINQFALGASPESPLTSLVQLNQGAAFDRFINNVFSTFDIKFKRQNRHTLGIEGISSLIAAYAGDLNFVGFFVGSAITRAMTSVIEKIKLANQEQHLQDYAIHLLGQQNIVSTYSRKGDYLKGKQIKTIQSERDKVQAAINQLRDQ